VAFWGASADQGGAELGGEVLDDGSTNGWTDLDVEDALRLGLQVERFEGRAPDGRTGARFSSALAPLGRPRTGLPAPRVSARPEATLGAADARQTKGDEVVVTYGPTAPVPSPGAEGGDQSRPVATVANRQ
jgi:hypothetical protein